ncbi:hypothetical protein HMPREF9554_02257 [Treponema phagedenis F0421]|nr:hypothetical protein HMPREF9554_02257 [Treponema phagedenis F0421]
MFFIHTSPIKSFSKCFCEAEPEKAYYSGDILSKSFKRSNSPIKIALF